MVFNCKRCGASFDQKGNLIRHLKSKAQCDILREDIDRDLYLKELTREKVSQYHKFICKYCGKGFMANNNRYTHQKICKANESVEQRIELFKKSLINLI